MAAGFTHQLSRWLRSGKHKEPKSLSAAVSSNVESNSSDSRRNKDSSFIGRRQRMRMNERRWRNNDEEEEEERDKEYDMVDHVESDSSDMEWSIGWLEPHGLEFQGEDDSENSFAVLVPCYRSRHIHLDIGDQGRRKHQSSLTVTGTEGNNNNNINSYYMEKWMSYLKKS